MSYSSSRTSHNQHNQKNDYQYTLKRHRRTSFGPHSIIP
jgi:hypothetical protein